jgi:hypothetical protein
MKKLLKWNVNEQHVQWILPALLATLLLICILLSSGCRSCPTCPPPAQPRTVTVRLACMDPVYPRISELIPEALLAEPEKNGDDYKLTSKQYAALSNLLSELVYYIETQYARCAEGAASAIPPTP